MLLYIHGFRTTINSHKSKVFKEYYKDKIIISDHPYEPLNAINYLEKVIKKHNITGIIASSIGGFYATYLCEKYKIKTVLINPSVKPYKTTTKYLGINTTIDGDEFKWKKKHLKQLDKLKIKHLKKKNYYIFLQTGDEVLNYKVAKKRYTGAKMLIETGGNHRFKNIERFFGDISEFLNHKDK